MSEPAQKPEESKQDYQTPTSFIQAVVEEFCAHIAIDLAANASNTQCVIHYGPGAQRGYEDSLTVDWSTVSGDCWLNPPFADIAPWAKKCATTERNGRIFLLTPASVGSNWYSNDIHGKAHVVALSPRLTFVGWKDPYPKDLMLSIFSGVRGGFSTWRWR
jgi:DNA (cytosine-5)-methyltransferase 1